MKDSIKRLYSQFKAQPKYMRVTTYLVFTYAVFLLLVGVITPFILQKQIPSQLTNLTGRAVTVGKVSINPFLLRITVDDFNIADAKKDSTFVGFKQLQFEPLFWKSVFTLTPMVDYVTLSSPQVHISSITDSQGNLVLSFQDILTEIEKNSAPQETQQTTPNSPAPVAFKANKIAIIDGSVSYADNSKKVTFRYPKIDFTLDNVDSLSLLDRKKEDIQSNEKPIDFNKFAFSLTGQEKHSIDLDGQFQLYPLKVNSQLAIEHFKLPSVWPYAEDYLNGQLSKGELAFSTQIALTEENKNLIIRTHQGKLSLTNLLLTTKLSQPQISLGSLTVSQIGVDSSTQSVLINAIKLNQLNIQSELQKNGINLAELYKAPLASTSTSTAEKTPEKPTEPTAESAVAAQSTPSEKNWLVVLNTFNLTNSQISVIDNAIAQNVKWQLNPINIQLSDIQSDLAKPIQYQVDLGVFNTVKTEQKPTVGTIHAQGLVDNKQQKMDGNIKITGIDLTDIQPYLTPYINIDLKKGLLSTDGTIHTAFNGNNLTFNGNIAINDLHINDKLEHKPFLSWSEMSVDKLAFDQDNASLSIDTITLANPYAKVLIDKNKNTNINDILNTGAEKTAANQDPKKEDKQPSKTQETAKTEKQAQGSNSLKIAINKIVIKEGSAYFSDQSLTPNFASGINSINGFIGKLTSDANTAAKVDLKGKIDKYAPLTIKGEINPLLATPYLDLALDIKGAELTSINPYSGTYAGYFIDKGQMSLTLNYWLKENQLKGSNHVFIDQLKLGEPSNSKQATSLPIKLAIALLQDRNGVIDLGVNVSGNLNDPSFGIGSVVLTALKNIVVKAVTAPFSLLANLIGSDDELNIVAFTSGSSAIGQDEQQRLTKLAKALTERPKLKLNIEGHLAKSSDSIALAEMQLQDQLQKVSGLPALPEGLTASRLPLESSLIDGLETLYTQQFGDIGDSVRDYIESKMKEASPEKSIDDNEVEKRLHITMYNQLVNAQEVSADALAQLAYTRSTNVKSFLVNQQHIDPQRIFIVNSQLGQKKDKSEVTITLNN